jgi:hypothetical protein
VRINDLPDEDRRKFMALGMGRSLPFWKEVIALQLHRLDGLQKQLPAANEHFAANFNTYAGNNPVMNTWTLQIQADSHFLLVSIRHVLRLGREFSKLTAVYDERPSALLQDFLSKYRDAESLRGILEHFDAYSVGGKIDVRIGIGPETRGLQLESSGEQIILVIGKRKLPLIPLGQAAAELANGLDFLWEELVMRQSPTALATVRTKRRTEWMSDSGAYVTSESSVSSAAPRTDQMQ